jgi:hypothetical protein
MPAGSAIIAIPQAGLDKTKWKNIDKLLLSALFHVLQ